MATPTPEDHFDRSKPFYPLIVVYTAALHGLTGLMARGVMEIAHDISGTPTFDQVLNEISTGDDKLDEGLRKLRGPLDLRAECIGRTIPSQVIPMAREIVENHPALLPWLMPTLGSVLLLTHEIVKQQLLGLHDPILEFLRHTRNAVGHNGCWEFRNGEPRRPAVWRGFTLDASMHGDRLFKGCLWKWPARPWRSDPPTLGH
jgi:hypothetical protein